MTHKLLALYGLKWNPFSADIPVEELWRSPKVEHFCWRMETLLREGGFALITGDPGAGKSVALRTLAHHCASLPDVRSAVLTRPQSSLADFYRELGHLFGVDLRPHNRWTGFKSLRTAWLQHLENTRWRPVLLIDEAQEMPATVLAELRILASADFDSRSLLTVVLCGDGRLTQQFRQENLVPIASRIRVRLHLGPWSPKELLEWLRHALASAGNPQLLTPELQDTLAQHAAGNLRVISNLAYELLTMAARRELAQIDQKLYLETFPPPTRSRNRALNEPNPQP